MGIQRWRIVHTRGGVTLADTETSGTDDKILRESININESDSIETSVDSFNFSVNNSKKQFIKSDYSLFFEIEDGIKIYFKNSSDTFTDNDLIISGMITEISCDSSVDGRSIDIQGRNRLEMILKNLKPAGYSSKTASYIIGNLIDQTNKDNDTNPSKQISKSISTTTYSFDYTEEYLPVYQHIERLSSNEYTQNGAYIYWLDTDNAFHWQPRPTTISSTITEGTDYILKIKAEKGSWNVINVIVINAGDDLNGNPVLTLCPNWDSIYQIGAKWKYLQLKNLAARIIANTGTVDNDTLRTMIRKEAKRIGDYIVTHLAAPSWRAEIEMRGTLDYIKGNIYTIAAESVGWKLGKSLRLTKLRHIFSSTRGWRTILSFEQDEDSAIQELTEISGV